MPRIKVGQTELNRIIKNLSDRDLAILKSVSEFKLLTAPQVEALHFSHQGSKMAQVRSSRRTLERLFNQRVLIRLERRIGGVRAGSSSFIYGIGPIGNRILFPDLKKRPNIDPSYAFITHTLAISQIFTDLTIQSKLLGFELEYYETEPKCWRQFKLGFGVNQILKPDLFLVLSNEHEQFFWFIEVDLSSESTKAIARKCNIYNSYFNTGVEQQNNGTFPKVLWIVNSYSRFLSISQTIKDLKNVNQELFTVSITENASNALTGELLNDT